MLSSSAIRLDNRALHCLDDPADPRVPVVLRLACTNKAGLALQDHAIAKHLQVVCLERGAGGGDVDDDIRLACCRRTLGSP